MIQSSLLLKNGIPGSTQYPGICLETGLLHDSALFAWQEFAWNSLAYNPQIGCKDRSELVSKDLIPSCTITIQVHIEKLQILMTHY